MTARRHTYNAVRWNAPMYDNRRFTCVRRRRCRRGNRPVVGFSRWRWNRRLRGAANPPFNWTLRSIKQTSGVGGGTAENNACGYCTARRKYHTPRSNRTWKFISLRDAQACSGIVGRTSTAGSARYWKTPVRNEEKSSRTFFVPSTRQIQRTRGVLAPLYFLGPSPPKTHDAFTSDFKPSFSTSAPNPSLFVNGFLSSSANEFEPCNLFGNSKTASVYRWYTRVIARSVEWKKKKNQKHPSAAGVFTHQKQSLFRTTVLVHKAATTYCEFLSTAREHIISVQFFVIRGVSYILTGSWEIRFTGVAKIKRYSKRFVEQQKNDSDNEHYQHVTKSFYTRDMRPIIMEK